MQQISNSIATFGECRLDRRRQILWRADAVVEIDHKPWALLNYFLDHPDRLVTKDELMANVWQGTVVAPAALTQSVVRLRAVLGDDARDPSYIRTVHRRGFRFVAEINWGEPVLREDAGRRASELSRAEHRDDGLIAMARSPSPNELGSSRFVGRRLAGFLCAVEPQKAVPRTSCRVARSRRRHAYRIP